MEKYYLIIPHLKIINANADSSPYTVGFPAMTAWMGMVHALERNLKQHDSLQNIKLPKVSISCHSCTLQAYMDKYMYYPSLTGKKKPLIPINKHDFGQPPFIEEAICHLDVTLLIEVTGITNMDIADAVQTVVRKILPRMKAVGGDIILRNQTVEHWKVIAVKSKADETKLKYQLMPGNIIIERSYLMAYNDDKDALDCLLDILQRNTDAKGWLVPIAVGFRDLSGAITVKNQRSYNTEHHFVEPIITIGEFVPAFRFQSLDEMMWEYLYDDENGLYLCKNMK
ncbi:type I-F CRISPR-associated protein Csy2 [Selenomonas ruminantium]|uniref:type I-F CRISPR-associated protein Csy2 n=1 Tax=Selenomonas ruminantium TaxID=971 RepID=UPI0026F1922F|nr:type I-F CRISPR-associated protein Csy2 [Selenomonas ruminantium]